MRFSEIFVSTIFIFLFCLILGFFSALHHNYSAYFGFDPFDNSNPGFLFFFKHNINVALLLWAICIYNRHAPLDICRAGLCEHTCRGSILALATQLF